MTADLPVLSPATCRAYLERLVVPTVRRDLAGLTVLQTAHLRALPFHNLFLLAGAGAAPDEPSLEAAVEGALRGWGGTCHLLSPPFVALLRALGFEAWLAAASVGAPGDHVVGVVRLPEGVFVCDVGNGHPYLRPFRLDTEESAQSAYGWRFAFGPCPEGQALGTHRLRRFLPDGTWKTTYAVDPRPVDYATFAGIIREHHTRVGFGPFMTGLRAVRMLPDVLVTLRDRRLERFHRSGLLVSRRHVADDAAIGRVLDRCFDLGALPWRAALAALRARDPDRWAPSVEVAAEPMRVLVSVGVTDRPGALTRIGTGLMRARVRAALPPDGVGLLALDNGSPAGALAHEAAALRAEGLPTAVVPAEVAARWHDRLFARGLVADPPGARPVSIATCRSLQVAALWEHLAGTRGVAGLPRGESPAVWMLDDDLEFSRLEMSAEGLVLRPAYDALATVATLRAAYPDISVLVGGTTGCPPIPGFAMLASQVVDLEAHVECAARSAPDAPVANRTHDRPRADYYYDHSDAGPAYGEAFAWEPIDRSARTVREALLAHLRAVPGLGWGMPCTRLIVYEPLGPIEPTTARGGNALFLDADALFTAPPLALRCRDGVVTRRGDTVWAELMAGRPASVVVRVPLSLHHIRRPGDHSAPLADADPSPAATRRFVAAQIRGTALARLVAARRRGEILSASVVMAERARRLRASLAVVHQCVPRLAAWAFDRTAWWSADPEVSEALRGASTTIERIAAAMTELGDAEPEVAAELDGFAATIPAAVERWQELWQ